MLAGMTDLSSQLGACAAGFDPEPAGDASPPVIDLRTISLEARRALCVEAEFRARAGEAPPAIRAALRLSKASYSQWAKLFGFRQCDLHPDKKRVGAPPLHPPGPGGYVGSGRAFRGLPIRGAPSARAELASLDTAAEVLDAVRAAREAGDIGHADRLLIAWKTRARRARDLEALEAEVEASMSWQDEIDQLSDEQLAEEVSQLTGKRFRVIPDQGQGVRFAPEPGGDDLGRRGLGPSDLSDLSEDDWDEDNLGQAENACILANSTQQEPPR